MILVLSHKIHRYGQGSEGNPGLETCRAPLWNSQIQKKAQRILKSIPGLDTFKIITWNF